MDGHHSNDSRPSGDGLHPNPFLALRRFGVPEEARVVSGDEAGRDGLWLHCFFSSQGVENAVGDSASIVVNRRYRRAKMDRPDGRTLLTMLLRHAAGENRSGVRYGSAWRVYIR